MTRYDPRPYIEAQHWVYAKTMPENPHEYVVGRQSTDYEAHLTFLTWIRRTGRTEVFQGRRYRYVVVDGWRYWALGPRDTIINRRRPYISTPCAIGSLDLTTHRCEGEGLPPLATSCECLCHEERTLPLTFTVPSSDLGDDWRPATHAKRLGLLDEEDE